MSYQEPRGNLQRRELHKLPDAARVQVPALEVNVEECLGEMIQIPAKQACCVEQRSDGQKDKGGRRAQSEADQTSEQVASRPEDD